MKNTETPEHLGDGVYISVESEMVTLTTEREYGSALHTIYIEDGVLVEFLRWLKRRGVNLEEI
jgi:hypothetical protein